MLCSLGRGIALTAALLCVPAFADEPPTIPRIGVLPQSDSRFDEAFLQGLHELGYIEGKSIFIEWKRSVDMNEEQIRPLAMELARSKVAIIVALSSSNARAALRATNLPVVFLSGDPVGAGLAESLARPGGNGTGVSVVTTQLDHKRLEFLRQLTPRARSIAHLRNPANPLTGKVQLENTARTLGIKLIPFEARNGNELDAALHAMAQSKPDGVIVAGDALFFKYRVKVVQALHKAKMPAIFPWAEYQEEGVLMSYGANLTDAIRRTASYVDKILKGAKPSDIPIEQISKYELIINLRVARELRLEIPQSLLILADEVIR